MMLLASQELSARVLRPGYHARRRRGAATYPDGTEREVALAKARKQHTGKGQNKDSGVTDRRLKLTHPRNAHLFHIDGGLLYYNSPLRGEVICVPQGLSTLAQEVGGRLGKRLGLWHSLSLPSRNTS